MDLQHMENGIDGASGSFTAGGGYQSSEITEAEFQRLSQTITASIQKIVQNVTTMQRMVNQFNTPQDSPDLKKQLHQILTYTQKLVSDTDNQLLEANKCKERHLKIKKDRLIDEFTAALTTFQALQRKTVDIEKDAIRQARANSYNIAKPPGSRDGSNSNSNNSSFLEDNFFNRKSNQQQQQQQQIQQEVDLESLEELEGAIRELEKNIVGVNEIYKKLGSMVYEQGVTVDSIESSVEQTSVFVSQGSENLRKALSSRNRMRKKKLTLFSILAVVLFIIVLILVLKFTN